MTNEVDEMSRRLLLGLVMAVLLAGALTPMVLAMAGPLPSEVQEVRAAVARYHSVAQAVRDGYSLEGQPCVTSPLGTMGYHAVNRDLLQSGANDPKRPPILLYVPGEDGNLKLAGVEYWAIALANTPDGPAPYFTPPDSGPPPPDGFATTAPSLFGQTFNGPMPGHNPSMPWHYDLHVWLFEANPAGLFAPFNTALGC